MKAALAKAPPLAEGTHIYDALTAAVAQVRGSALAAARVVLLSDGDDVGSAATLDSALEQLEGAGHPRLHGRHRVARLQVGRPREDRRARPEGTYAAASSPEALTQIYDELGFKLGNEYLLRYRSQAQPDQDVDVTVAVVGAEPVSFSYTSPSTGTAAPFEPAFRDRFCSRRS